MGKNLYAIKFKDGYVTHGTLDKKFVKKLIKENKKKYHMDAGKLVKAPNYKISKKRLGIGLKHVW